MAVLGRATESAIHRRLRSPACVFLIVFGVAKLAELADWSRLHGDVTAMLGLGSGTVTGLLAAGEGAELLLTALAVLALTRGSTTPLLVALTGWSADLLLLTVVAGVCGDRVRMLEHGLTFIAFAGLLAVIYVYGGVHVKDILRAVRRERPSSPPETHEPHETLHDVPDPDAGSTRQDLPARGPAVTRQDLPLRRPDVTRQDLPVRKRPAAEPPRDR